MDTFLSYLAPQDNPTIQDTVPYGLAQVAGAGAGLGAGVLASIPLAAHHQNKMLAKAMEETKQKEQTLKQWKILLDLYKRKLTLNDLPEQDRGYYEQLFKDNYSEIHQMAKDPIRARENYDYLKSGNVTPLFGPDSRAKMKGLFLEKVQHPHAKKLTGLLTLTGAIGGGAGYRYLTEQKQE